MGEAPHDPPPASGGNRDADSEPAAAARPLGSPETVGPLILRRFIKADGRALLMYERARAADAR